MQGLRLKIFVSFTGGNGLPPRVLGVVDINHHCWDYHYAKIAQIRSFIWSLFSHIWTAYGEIRSISPYSVRIRENTDQKKLRFCYYCFFVCFSFSQPAHSSKIFVRECIIICKQLNPQNICMSLIGFFIIENTYAVIQGNISIFSFSTSEVHYRKDM